MGWASKLQDVFKDSESGPRGPGTRGRARRRPRGLGPPGRVADHPIADSGTSTGKVRLDPRIDVPPALRGPQGGPFDPRPIEALPADRPSRFGIAHRVSATFSDLRIATAYSSYPAER